MIPFSLEKEVRRVMSVFHFLSTKKKIELIQDLCIRHPWRVGDPLR